MTKTAKNKSIVNIFNYMNMSLSYVYQDLVRLVRACGKPHKLVSLFLLAACNDKNTTL